MVARSLALAIVFAVALAVTGPAPAAQATPTAADLLARYDRGEWASVTAALAELKDLRAFRSDLNMAAGRWIAAGGRDLTDRRRMVAASLALEAAGTGLDRWESARHLVEWGCALLREGPPTPLERVWQMAAVGLIDRVKDDVFLIGLPLGFADGDKDRGKAKEHLMHAESRFPDEARFRLARAVALELQTWGGNPREPVWIDRAALETLLSSSDRPIPKGLRTDEDTAVHQIARSQSVGLGFAGVRTVPLFLMQQCVTLWEFTRALQRLTGVTAIAPEVHVRLASTYFRLARPDLAVAQLRQVDLAGADPDMVFLTHFFNGRRLEDTGDPAAAIASYRLALAAVPRAQSASMALASLLFTGDGREEAAALVDAAFRAPVPDPAREYAAADFRMWPALIRQLHEGLR